MSSDEVAETEPRPDVDGSSITNRPPLGRPWSRPRGPIAVSWNATSVPEPFWRKGLCPVLLSHTNLGRSTRSRLAAAAAVGCQFGSEGQTDRELDLQIWQSGLWWSYVHVIVAYGAVCYFTRFVGPGKQ